MNGLSITIANYVLNAYSLTSYFTGPFVALYVYQILLPLKVREHWLRQSPSQIYSPDRLGQVAGYSSRPDLPIGCSSARLLPSPRHLRRLPHHVPGASRFLDGNAHDHVAARHHGVGAAPGRCRLDRHLGPVRFRGLLRRLCHRRWHVDQHPAGEALRVPARGRQGQRDGHLRRHRVADGGPHRHPGPRRRHQRLRRCYAQDGHHWRLPHPCHHRLCRHLAQHQRQEARGAREEEERHRVLERCGDIMSCNNKAFPSGRDGGLVGYDVLDIYIIYVV